MTRARSLTSLWLSFAVCLGLVALSPGVLAATKTTLTFLHWMTDPVEQASQLQRVALFEAAHPDVKMEVLFSSGVPDQRQKIMTMHAAGIAPDLFVVSRRNQYELWANGLIMPVTKYVGSRDLRFEDIINTEQLRMDGEYIGISHHGGGQLLGFNAELFAGGGVEPADASYRAGRWNIATFQDAVRKITRDANGDGIPDVYGMANFAGADPFMSMLRAFGVTLLDPESGDPRINTPQGIEAIRLVSELCLVYNVVGGNFAAGTRAIECLAPRPVFVSWGQSSVYPFEWNIIPYPKATGDHRNVGGHNFYAISSQCKHPDLAFAFIEFELRPELVRQQLLAGEILTPVRLSTCRDPVLRTRFPGLHLDVWMLAASDYLVPETVRVPGFEESLAIATREVAQAVQGQQSPEQAAARIHDQIVRVVQSKFRN